MQRLTFEQRHGGSESGHSAVTAIDRIVLKLTGGSWKGPVIRTAVLGTDEPNAYILPSGHLYVTSGMLDLACTSDELAAVIAHELAHLDNLEVFFKSDPGTSRALAIESAADERAIPILLEAQYDPRALVAMITRLTDDQPDGWAEYRCDRLKTCMAEQGVPIASR